MPRRGKGGDFFAALWQKNTTRYLTGRRGDQGPRVWAPKAQTLGWLADRVGCSGLRLLFWLADSAEDFAQKAARKKQKSGFNLAENRKYLLIPCLYIPLI